MKLYILTGILMITLGWKAKNNSTKSVPAVFNDTPRYQFFIKVNATEPELQRAGFLMDSIMKNHGKSLSVDQAQQDYQIFLNALSFLYTRMQKDSVLIKPKK